MSQVESHLAMGMVKFYSKDDLKKYLKGLAELYQGQANHYGDKLGALIRTSEQQKQAGAKTDAKLQAKGWVKMGSLLVNQTDPVASMTEIMYQLHEEFKQKLARTTDALKSFEEGSAAMIPEGVSLALHLRNGVPERLVADSQSTKKESFRFSGKFVLV